MPYDAKNFSSKIKLLRNTYDLSLAEMSEMLSLKNKTAIYAWENGTSFPQFDKLVNLANFFSISLDWLVGRSQIIYTQESIIAGEASLSANLPQEYLPELQLLSSGRYINIVADYVSCLELRKINYSLSVRANLTVLLHFVSLPDLYWAEEYLKNDQKKRGVSAKVQARLASISSAQAENYKEPGKKAKERAINLVTLLQQPSASPIYDVEAAYAELLTK